jgi:hypothetical protein
MLKTAGGVILSVFILGAIAGGGSLFSGMNEATEGLVSAIIVMVVGIAAFLVVGMHDVHVSLANLGPKLAAMTLSQWALAVLAAVGLVALIALIAFVAWLQGARDAKPEES